MIYSDTIYLEPGSYRVLVELPAYPKDLTVTGGPAEDTYHCGGLDCEVRVSSQIVWEGFYIEAHVTGGQGVVEWTCEI